MIFNSSNLKLLFLLSLIFYFLNELHGQENISPKTDSIVIILIKNNIEKKGVFISANSEKIVIDIGNNETLTIPHSEIKSIHSVTGQGINNKIFIKNNNPDFTKYCLLPTAFTSKKGEFSESSHYFSIYNSKYGITDNLELSLSGILLNIYIVGVSYSKEIFEFARIGISTYGGILWGLSDPSYVNETGIGLIPRITFGNKNSNVTMGFTGVKAFSRNEWYYGGYFGAQRKLNKTWTFSGELIGITYKVNHQIYMGNVSFSYYIIKRNTTWTYGLGGININDPKINNNNYPFVPFPYVGFKKSFY